MHHARRLDHLTSLMKVVLLKGYLLWRYLLYELNTSGMRRARRCTLANLAGQIPAGGPWEAASSKLTDTHTWCMCRYVSAMGNHVVNPVITPSAASGTPSGVMAAALVGPDYKYTAVWTPINMQLGGSSAR